MVTEDQAGQSIIDTVRKYVKDMGGQKNLEIANALYQEKKSKSDIEQTVSFENGYFFVDSKSNGVKLYKKSTSYYEPKWLTDTFWPFSAKKAEVSIKCIRHYGFMDS